MLLDYHNDHCYYHFSSRCSLDPVQPRHTGPHWYERNRGGCGAYTPTSQRSNTHTPHTPPSGLITSTAHPHIQAIPSETRQSSPSQTRPAHGRRRQVVIDAEQQLLDIISIPTSNVPPHVPTAQEEMYYFALSLVPKLNRLSREAQAQAQTHILTCLTELEDRQLAQRNTPGPIRGSNSSTSTVFHPYSSTPSPVSISSCSSPRWPSQVIFGGFVWPFTPHLPQFVNNGIKCK